MSTVAEPEVQVTGKSGKAAGAPTKKDYEVPEGGFDAVPDWYDPKVYKTLKKGDFKDEAVYLEWKADRLERQAKRIRNEVHMLRSIGTVEDRKKAAKLQRMQKEMASLVAQLQANNVDVASYLAKKDDDES